MERCGPRSNKQSAVAKKQGAAKSSTQKSSTTKRGASGEAKRGRTGSKGKSSAAKAGKGRSGSKKKEMGSKSKSEDKKKKSKSKGKGRTSMSAQKKGGKKGKKEEKEESKDQVKPTKALNAFFFYVQEAVPGIKKDEGLKHTDATRRAGELWAQMSDKEKDPYVKLHDKDVKRYEKQLEELKDKGYFIMADGTKSSEVEVKKRKSRKTGKSMPKQSKRKTSRASGKKKKEAAKKEESEEQEEEEEHEGSQEVENSDNQE